MCSLYRLFPAIPADVMIQDRLRSHAQAFDGLLSLIPAKYYYGEDNSVCCCDSHPYSCFGQTH